MTQEKAVSTTEKPKEKDITGAVLSKIETFRANGELKLPNDYSAENALKSAWLILQDVKDKNERLAIHSCTPESIANSLLKMVVWGLSPLKKQCDFIVYGNTLTCMPEYTGNIALAKRYGGLKDIKANAIFAGDEFSFEVDSNTGRKKVISHTQTLDSIGSNDIKGAYAVIEMQDGTRDVEIMNITQIRAAWAQGAAKGQSGAHKNFTDQMAIKTVINRACKLLIRSSDDNVLFENDSDQNERVIHHRPEREELTFEDANIVDSPNEPIKEESKIKGGPDYHNSDPEPGTQIECPI